VVLYDLYVFFCQFTKEQIQTPWTSLNSEVLASNNERVLFPINESAPGKKESQITEYLNAYNGPGVQRIL
jgi:4-hydroxyphenylpyruvate dioxygenase